jgi:hypothetical protein
VLHTGRSSSSSSGGGGSKAAAETAGAWGRYEQAQDTAGSCGLYRGCCKMTRRAYCVSAAVVH